MLFVYILTATTTGGSVTGEQGTGEQDDEHSEHSDDEQGDASFDRSDIARPVDYSKLIGNLYQPVDYSKLIGNLYRPVDYSKLVGDLYRPVDYSKLVRDVYQPPDYNKLFRDLYQPPDYGKLIANLVRRPDYSQFLRSVVRPIDFSGVIRQSLGPSTTRHLAASFGSISTSELLGMWAEASALSEDTPHTDGVISRLQVDVPSVPPAVLVGLVMSFVWLVSMAILSGVAIENSDVAKDLIGLTGLSPAFISTALAGWSG